MKRSSVLACIRHSWDSRGALPLPKVAQQLGAAFLIAGWGRGGDSCPISIAKCFRGSEIASEKLRSPT